MILVLSLPEINHEQVDHVLKIKNINNDINKESDNDYRHFISNEWVADQSLKYSAALILSNTLVSHSFLDQVIDALQVHSKLTIRYIIENFFENESRSFIDAAGVDLKLLGLLSVESNSGECFFEVSGVKPDLSQGTATRRLLKRSKFTKEALKSVLSSSEPVSLLEDSDLLNEEDVIKPEISREVAEECGPMAKKKACKNCSCGLKELEESNEKNEVVIIDTTNVKSSCGSVSCLHKNNNVKCYKCFYLLII